MYIHFKEAIARTVRTDSLACTASPLFDTFAGAGQAGSTFSDEADSYRVGLSSSLVSKVVDICFIHIPSSSYITSALAKHAIFAQCHPELKLCSITVNRNCSSRAFCGLVPFLACKASSGANCRDNATNIENEGADDNVRA